MKFLRATLIAALLAVFAIPAGETYAMVNAAPINSTVLVTSEAPLALAANNQVVLKVTMNQLRYTVNGTPAMFDVAPYLDNAANRSMIPLRFIAEAFGAAVSWNDATKTQTIKLDGKTFTLTQNVPLPDGMGTPVLVKDRFFAPLRYVSEKLGASVDWDNVTQTNTIIYGSIHGDAENTAPIDVYPSMGKTLHKNLNMFFSNFSEVGCLNEFDINNYNVSDVVNFALVHDYINNFSRFSAPTPQKGYLKISEDYVLQNLNRYLGITNINLRDYGDRLNYAMDGYFYYVRSVGGPTRWSQVRSFVNNFNGTYTAQIDVYESYVPPVNLYEDKDDWRLPSSVQIVSADEPGGVDPRYECVYIFSSQAIVRPYEYNGTLSYQLISLRTVS